MATQTAERATTRNTIQRALVLEAVRSLHNHPTSADVYEVVREKHPNISRATVYRNLGVLANRGEVLRVEVPNGADRYDFLNRPHYHAKCRVCGGVFDVDMPYRRARVRHRGTRDHLQRRVLGVPESRRPLTFGSAAGSSHAVVHPRFSQWRTLRKRSSMARQRLRLGGR